MCNVTIHACRHAGAWAAARARKHACIPACAHIRHERTMHARMRVWTRACVSACVNACMRACLRASMHARMRALTRARPHARTHACSHARMLGCRHARMHPCMRACTHARTHAWTHARHYINETSSTSHILCSYITTTSLTNTNSPPLPHDYFITGRAARIMHDGKASSRVARTN